MAVKSACQSAYDPAEDKHFSNAYDNFWQTLGGVDMPGEPPVSRRRQHPAVHAARVRLRRRRDAAIAHPISLGRRRSDLATATADKDSGEATRSGGACRIISRAGAAGPDCPQANEYKVLVSEPHKRLTSERAASDGCRFAARPNLKVMPAKP